MVLEAGAVLLLAGEAVLAAVADAGGEAYADEAAGADVVVDGLDGGAEGDDARDAFVAADMGELDLCDRGAGGAGGGAFGCVEVLWGVGCELGSGRGECG